MRPTRLALVGRLSRRPIGSPLHRNAMSSLTPRRAHTSLPQLHTVRAHSRRHLTTDSQSHPRNSGEAPAPSSTSPPSTSSNSNSSLLHRIETILRWRARPFAVNSSNISVLRTPTEFFDSLMERCHNAQDRIYFTSLYLGNGKKSKELTEAVQSVVAGRPNLKFRALLDYNRGTRGLRSGNSSVDMLSGVLGAGLSCQEGSANTERATLHLFRSPVVGSFARLLARGPLIEMFGVQHMKMYVVDDTVFITGANLSDDYFTNRQDRYVVIRDAALANFCTSVSDLVAKWSYQADPERTGELSPPVNFQSSVGEDGRTFALSFAKALSNVMQNGGDTSDLDDGGIEDDDESGSNSRTHMDSESTSSTATADGNVPAADTWVFPFSQFGYGNVKDEEGLLGDLLGPHLTGWRHEAQLTLATGYMNLPAEYVDLLLKSPCEVRVVTASPVANGFFRAGAMKSFVPDFYRILERNFLQAVSAAERSDDISLYEYRRDAWTFHTKGLWLTDLVSTSDEDVPTGSESKSDASANDGEDEDPSADDSQQLPCFTIVGSTNFGRRSRDRDLECSFGIVTRAASLQRKFGQELSDLAPYSKPIDKVVDDPADKSSSVPGPVLALLTPVMRGYF